MEPKLIVRTFLRDMLDRKGDTQPLLDDASLLLSGRLQSIDAVEIVVFLETQFSVDFALTGFDAEKIDSVDTIVALVKESAWTS